MGGFFGGFGGCFVGFRVLGFVYKAVGMLGVWGLWEFRACCVLGLSGFLGILSLRPCGSG